MILGIFGDELELRRVELLVRICSGTCLIGLFGEKEEELDFCLISEGGGFVTGGGIKESSIFCIEFILGVLSFPFCDIGKFVSW